MAGSSLCCLSPRWPWAVCEKEMFALYYCIKKLRYLIGGRRFYVKSDHKNLLDYAYNIFWYVVVGYGHSFEKEKWYETKR